MSIDAGSRRSFLVQLAALSHAGKLTSGNGDERALRFGNSSLEVIVRGTQDCLWSYKRSKREHRIAPPVFNIDGKPITATLLDIIQDGEPTRLKNETTEYLYRGTFADHPKLSLVMQFRVADDNPIVRFRYRLESQEQNFLTKPSGRDELVYLRVDASGLFQLTEIRLSNFIELWHSYSLEKAPVTKEDLEGQVPLMGPIITASDGIHSTVIAYEHGSQYPDAFLQFTVGPDRILSLQAAKSNYLTDQPIDKDHAYETVWFETAAVEGDESALATAFRRFVLERMSQNLASRQPHICYNTWNFQERNRWWNGKAYTESMNLDRILREIDVAHRLGIEVYVLDAGWYGLTGDWNVNLERFPDGLRDVKARLDRYSMKLGLWFGVTTADTRSAAYKNHQDCVMSWKGQELKPSAGFTSDQNYPMCLVSRYGEAFLGQLIRLFKETGVTYFKWDGVEQNVCDSPHHWHGTGAHSAAERADSHAFQLVQQMCWIADKLAETCPEAIIDFDITERYRAVGLSFLSSGRYFLVNNGPYYHSFDIPNHKDNSNWNILFYPGPARTWFCRSPLTFNQWVPSTLFLTHYFPDDPIPSQEVNLASLVLGQNGIWGDLLGISEAGIHYISGILSQYKKVRDAANASDPLVTGSVSGSPEIYEHIHSRSGRGVVTIFANAPGHYSYVTRNKVALSSSTGEGLGIKIYPSGRARISCDFERPGAKILFFGTD
jgi:alpha-galactosidase